MPRLFANSRPGHEVLGLVRRAAIIRNTLGVMFPWAAAKETDTGPEVLKDIRTGSG